MVSFSPCLRDVVVIVGNLVLLSLEHGVTKPVPLRRCGDCGKSCVVESGTRCR
jgi:hypothetical protein